jgi:peroxiredoxin
MGLNNPRRFCALLAACLLLQQADAQELSFNLPDLDGKPVKLEKQDDPGLTVVCFLGTECPLVRLYASRLNEFAAEFADVRFIGVCSNLQDSPEDLRAFRDKHHFQFPFVIDRDNLVADQFQAQRTPEVFLLDHELTLRYQGRVDDQYQPGIAKSAPRRHDLRIAIKECLANEPVSVAITEPDGCLIGRVKNATNPDSKITYANQISRLLQNHCAECHRHGQIGPMELAQYNEVVGWADMIVEVVDDNRMPPWHADPNHGEFINERRMTTAEKQMLRDWVAAGTPKGNLAQLPPPRQFSGSTQWRLPKQPDLVIEMRSTPFTVPAEGTVEYQYFVVDPGLSEDKWVVAAEILPGDRSVLHHSIVYVRPPDGTDQRGVGQLAGFVPGQSAPAINPKFGRKIIAGSRFVFQQHYTPNGKRTKDLTKIGLVFGNEEEVENEVITLLALDQDFVIPPGAENHPVSGKFPWLPRRGSLQGLAPHMHVRGKSFQLTAKIEQHDDATGSSEVIPEILLSVPNYDFNWQHIYQLQNPIPMANLRSLEFVASFDNSTKNQANPNPNEYVFWGDQTDEEMAVAFAIVSVPRELDDSNPPVLTRDQQQALEKHEAFIQRKVASFVDVYFKRFDANADGQIGRFELPRSVRDHGLWQIDDDGDEIVTRDEVALAAERHFRKKHPFDPVMERPLLILKDPLTI